MYYNFRKSIQLFLSMLCLFLSTFSFAVTDEETLFQYEVYQDEVTQYYGVKQKGKVILPAQYQNIYVTDGKAFTWSDGMLLDVVKNNQLLRINKKGQVAFHAVWHDNGPDYYVKGLTRFITIQGKIGFHDRLGKVIIHAVYDFAAPFSDDSDYTAVCNGCYIKPLAHMKYQPLTSDVYSRSVPLGYDDMYYYRNLEGGEWGMIDRNGQEVILLKYSSQKEAEDAILAKQR